MSVFRSVAAVACIVFSTLSARAQTAGPAHDAGSLTSRAGSAGRSGTVGAPPAALAAGGQDLTGAAAAGPRSSPQKELKTSTSGATERGGK